MTFAGSFLLCLRFIYQRSKGSWESCRSQILGSVPNSTKIESPLMSSFSRSFFKTICLIVGSSLRTSRMWVSKLTLYFSFHRLWFCTRSTILHCRFKQWARKRSSQPFVCQQYILFGLSSKVSINFFEPLAPGSITGRVIIFLMERPVNWKIQVYENIIPISYSWWRRRWRIIDNWFCYGWLEPTIFVVFL